jgi:hypothetical protein
VWLSTGTRDLITIQGKHGTSSPDLSLLSLNTGSSENVTSDGPKEVESIDDDQVYPTGPASEPQLEPELEPELDAAPFEVAYVVEDVVEPPDDAWGFPTTVKSSKKEKKKSKKNLS